MHIFKVAFYISGAVYALFFEQGLLIPFIAVVVIYLIAGKFLNGGKDISTRKKIMLSTWSDPSEGVITVKVPVRTEKANQMIAKAGKETRLTLTHFAIKAVGELLKTQPDLNGKLVFGRWVPYQTIDVSCLVDIEGGKDLAFVCIKGVDKMSVEDIASFIKEKAKGMKKNQGGEEHKKKNNITKMLPAFLVSLLIEVTTLLTNKFGISVKSMALEKHPFGAACVTSLGMLGFEDAVAPFSGFTGCTIFAAINGSVKTPVVENDEIKIGEVMNCNFVVDHRYVDGGKCTKLVPAFRKVFTNPEEFMDVVMKQQRPRKMSDLM